MHVYHSNPADPLRPTPLSRNPRPREMRTRRAVPFDAGHSTAADPAMRLGLVAHYSSDTIIFCTFRNRDSRPPRSTVTAALMGDPPPGRPRPGDPDFPCQDEPRVVSGLSLRYRA